MDIHEIRELIEVDGPLTGEQLDDKYSPNGDGEHPLYSRAHWRDSVAQHDTIAGYWDWAAHLLKNAHTVYTAPSEPLPA